MNGSIFKQLDLPPTPRNLAVGFLGALGMLVGGWVGLALMLIIGGGR